MNYVCESAVEKHSVTFWGSDYPNMFEEGANEDQYFLTQNVKSWLTKNDIKVFVSYNCGDMGGGVPEFKLDFTNKQDAQMFVDTWSTK